MNNALIAVGLPKNTLEQEVFAVVAKVGTLLVDPREISCKKTDSARCIKNAKMRKGK